MRHAAPTTAPVTIPPMLPGVNAEPRGLFETSDAEEPATETVNLKLATRWNDQTGEVILKVSKVGDGLPRTTTLRLLKVRLRQGVTWLFLVRIRGHQKYR